MDVKVIEVLAMECKKNMSNCISENVCEKEREREGGVVKRTREQMNISLLLWKEEILISLDIF